ncbi:MAG: FtsH protease activity modulator HflK [Beijerinckiaceae bacterium]|nr:MAG: FtsH protease activity modulator HflK [Beijerinckiaceae bacterium]
MPWNNDGGNGGQNGGKNNGPWKSGGGPGPWGHTPGPRGPHLEDWLRRAQGKLRQWMPGGGLGGRSIIGLVLVGILLWLLSGFYTVGPNEVGLNMIFGRYTGKTASGLNYNLPFPIGSVEKLQVTNRNTTNIGFVLRQDVRNSGGLVQVELPQESLMLASEQNIADVKFVVIWQIDPAHPEYYAFNIADPRETVKAVAESAMREVIGRSQIQKILTAGRKVIEPEVQKLMQKILNKYNAGVLVLQVQLQSVEPPEQVIASFRDVIAAQQDADRTRNEAQAYANRVVPTARGKAAAIIQEAEGYRLQTVAQATGQASLFDQVYAQYKNAPEVTRERIYLETMEHVLGSTNKIIVDDPKSQGVVPYLPLPQLTPNNAEGAQK